MMVRIPQMINFIKHNSLKTFPLKDKSINSCITSPPYWGLRQYTDNNPDEIGNEKTIEEYLDKLYKVFTEVNRVLTDDGSLVVNIGDKYLDRELQSIPSRFELGMKDRGWKLINTIIWAKPNAMPTPVKHRLKNSYEHVFWFVKDSKNFYSDLDSIRKPHVSLKIDKNIDNDILLKKIKDHVEIRKHEVLFEGVKAFEEKNGYINSKLSKENEKNHGARGGFAKNGETIKNRYADGGKNAGNVYIDDEKKYDIFDIECPHCNMDHKFSLTDFGDNFVDDVWSICTVPSPRQHSAIFPRMLIQDIIKLTSRMGDTVLDTFAGSGTTSSVAESLGRNSVGFDIDYEEVREERLNEGVSTSLF